MSSLNSAKKEISLIATPPSDSLANTENPQVRFEAGGRTVAIHLGCYLCCRLGLYRNELRPVVGRQIPRHRTTQKPRERPAQSAVKLQLTPIGK